MGTKSYTRSRSLKAQKVKVRKDASIVPALLVVCVIISLGLFYVWSRTETLRTSYTVSEVQESLKFETNMNEELRGRVAQLKSPERIAHIAEQKLGLAFPKSSQVWPIGEKAEESSLKVARP